MQEFILPTLHITVQGCIILLKRLRFLLKWVLKSIEQAECNLLWSNGHYTWLLNRQQQKNCWEFRFIETIWPKLASPWDHHPSKPQELDKLRRAGSEAWAFLLVAFLFHSIIANCKMFVASYEQWQANKACPNSGLTAETCSRALSLREILDLHHRQPRSQFS